MDSKLRSCDLVKIRVSDIAQEIFQALEEIKEKVNKSQFLTEDERAILFISSLLEEDGSK